MNKVILMGRLSKEPELKTTPSGTAVLNASIATSEKRKDGDEYKEFTEFHNIVVWGKKAEIISQYFSKGDGILVEGKLQTRKWEDSNGVTRYSTEINVWNFEFPMAKARKNEGSKPEPKGDDGFDF